MSNFKKETYEAIEKSGHKRDDVMFVGSYDGEYRIDIDKFDKISDFNYDKGFGAAEIATDLIVCFKDGSYLEREEYDGSEWWRFVEPLKYTTNDEYKDFNYLKIRDGMIGWRSVKEINGESNE